MLTILQKTIHALKKVLLNAAEIQVINVKTDIGQLTKNVIRVVMKA